MSILLSCLATLGILVSLAISFKTEPKRSIRKLAVTGTVFAILMVWCLFYNEVCESSQLESRHQELKEMLDPILLIARAKNPSLEDKAAIESLLVEFEELIKWSGRLKRASMAGMTWPGGPSHNQNLISIFKNLLAHEDSSVRSAATTCLKAIGTPEASKALESSNNK